MTIDQTDVIDIVSTSDANPEARLIIADHLPWDEDEERHLWLLQNKINKYLGAIESGELYKRCPQTAGKRLVIDLAPKYSLSENAQTFVEKCQAIIKSFGLELRVRQSGGR